MYTKEEIICLFIYCQNLTQVFKVTELLRYLMDATNDFQHHAIVRRMANKQIVKFTKNNQI